MSNTSSFSKMLTIFFFYCFILVWKKQTATLTRGQMETVSVNTFFFFFVSILLCAVLMPPGSWHFTTNTKCKWVKIFNKQLSKAFKEKEKINKTRTKRVLVLPWTYFILRYSLLTLVLTLVQCFRRTYSTAVFTPLVNVQHVVIGEVGRESAECRGVSPSDWLHIVNGLKEFFEHFMRHAKTCVPK